MRIYSYNNNYYYAVVITEYTGLGGNDALNHQRYLYDHTEVRQNLLPTEDEAKDWCKDTAEERLAVFYARCTLHRGSAHPLYDKPSQYEQNIKVMNSHDLHTEEAFRWLMDRGLAVKNETDALSYSLTEAGKNWVNSYEKETAI